MLKPKPKKQKPTAKRDDKPKTKLGSKLASLAKATAEKSDHSTKDKNVKELETVRMDPDDAGKELSPEERRRIIQENIRKNLAMQKQVKEAKQRGDPRLPHHRPARCRRWLVAQAAVVVVVQVATNLQVAPAHQALAVLCPAGRGRGRGRNNKDYRSESPR